jgi:hypothetical protein
VGCKQGGKGGLVRLFGLRCRAGRIAEMCPSVKTKELRVLVQTLRSLTWPMLVVSLCKYI